jgi:DMSO/TMAO reductase YedYZ molybdopterin-dependent catalytic subunit
VTDYVLYILGAVKKPLRLTLKDIKDKYKKYQISATLSSAENRKKEFKAIKKVKGRP